MSKTTASTTSTDGARRDARAVGSSAPYVPQIRRYQDWLAGQRGLNFDSYDALWQWSVTDPGAFWHSIWDYFDLQSPLPVSVALADARMPGASWFPGVRLNYAQRVFQHVAPAHAAGLPAVVSRNERGLHRELSWPELRGQVASLALHLRAHGVQPGDRVVAYLPNVPETMIALLACASIGAVWSVCAPDMGTNAVLDRFAQIEPKVLIGCDGAHYNGRDLDRTAVLAELRAKLPTLEHAILLGNLDATKIIAGWADFAGACSRNDAETERFEPLPVPFDHPIWIVYSSGTTGLPKAIVHGHGGTVLVGLAQGALQQDIGCSYDENSFGERYHWYSSTGWIMWNSQTSGLLAGATCCIFDGNPAARRAGADQPDWTTLWRFAAETGVTWFGAGAAFYANCMKADVDLSACGDLTQVRALGSTGSPLAPDVQRWGTQQFARIGTPEIWWCNISGGTDFIAAVATGNPELPQVVGQMQCRGLGCALEAWNEQGAPVVNEVGELVLTQPLPSMPLRFWGDADNARYLSSYFDMYPGVWRHGDWVKVGADGGCTIYGRSDATINRHGLRMGTSELYSAIEALPEVLDSMVVDLEYLGRESYMPLFVVLREGLTLDALLLARIHGAIRDALSPRFLPDETFQVAEIPRTISGKKQELPIKKLLLGQPIEKVVNREAMANPACLDWYVAFADRHLQKTAVKPNA
ncbi:MAG: acetoacetate--CoA ligase [Burkholderiaceae bacterium]